MGLFAKRDEAGDGDGANDPLGGRHDTGILPIQSLRALIEDGAIASETAIENAQLQPASLDLRLGAMAYRVRASFLPGRAHTVGEKIDAYCMHAIDLSEGAVLESGCVYIVPLLESLALLPRLSGIANPKSSTGRLDVFTRLITDRAIEFDRVETGYHGPLYAEIAPRTFSILVRQGDRLNQLRLRRGHHVYSDQEMKRLHARTPLVHGPDGPGDEAAIANGVALTVDLRGPADGSGGDALIGYKARRHAALIELAKINHYEPLDFWEPIQAGHGGVADGLVLNPDDFYILASQEAVTVPPDHAAEMAAYDTLVGEFRVHYAGFFDPGFGDEAAGGKGTRAVLEVRSHDVPFMLEHGQTVGRLVYERLTDRPDKLYGLDMGSNYQRQTLALAKQFKSERELTAG